jgi:hypothetical protein
VVLNNSENESKDDLSARVEALEIWQQECEKRLEASVQAQKKLETVVRSSEQKRQEDMEQIMASLEKTDNARVLATVKDIKVVLDGDDYLRLKGVRQVVEENAADIAKLVQLRDRIFWIGLGIIAAAGGVSAVVTRLVEVLGH